MNNRLDYHKLLTNWMQFYTMTEEDAENMFTAIWARLQELKREEADGNSMEPLDREGDK